MKRRILLIYINVIFWLYAFSILNVYANGVPTPNIIRGPYETVFLIFILFVIAVGFEFLVFTQKSYDLAPRNSKLFLTFLKINLITFPLTQILAYMVYLYALNYYWIYILLIEILVVLAEWRLILIEFDRKYDHILYPKQALKLSIKANIISFFLGFVPYIVILILTMFSPV